METTAPDRLCDPASYDIQNPAWGLDAVRDLLPHRYEFEQVSGVLDYCPERQFVAGFRRYTEDDHWVRGHVPGNPILPGVLMIEAAAQLGTWYCLKTFGKEGFWALAEVRNVRYRDPVRPGDTVVYACQMTKLRRRLMRFRFQGFLDGKLVVQGEATGMRTTAPGA